MYTTKVCISFRCITHSLIRYCIQTGLLTVWKPSGLSFLHKIRPWCYAPKLPTTSNYALVWVLLCSINRLLCLESN